MPKVMVSASQPTNRREVIALVREVTGLAVSSVASRLLQGRSGWLLCADFFKGDHDDRAAEFRQLVLGLRQLGVEPYVVRVSSSKKWSEVEADQGRYAVTPDSVLAMLDRELPDEVS